MRGMEDITVVAHSKGGAVAEAFMALRQWSLVNAWDWATVMPHEVPRQPVPVNSYVLIDPAIEGPGAWGAVPLFGGHAYDVAATVPVITINPTANPDPRKWESWIGDTVKGAYNIQSQKSDHSLMVEYARFVTWLLRPSPRGPW
jgi:hypothetical protein